MVKIISLKEIAVAMNLCFSAKQKNVFEMIVQKTPIFLLPQVFLRSDVYCLLE